MSPLLYRLSYAAISRSGCGHGHCLTELLLGGASTLPEIAAPVGGAALLSSDFDSILSHPVKRERTYLWKWDRGGRGGNGPV